VKPYLSTANPCQHQDQFLYNFVVTIQIMKTFTRLREILATHEELRRKIEQMENKYDKQFKIVFEAIRQLVIPPAVPKRKIGFDLKEKQAKYGKKKKNKGASKTSKVSPEFREFRNLGAETSKWCPHI
jgi:hypothetical protein